MALRNLSRFVCTFLLVLSLLSVTNRALSVTSEQVCQGLDNVILNADPSALMNCMRDNNCTMVQCQVTGMTSLIIQRTALTLLPCQDPPSVRLQLWNPDMQVLVDQIVNETQTIQVDTSLGVLPLNFFLNRTTDNTEIGIKIDNNLQGTQTLISFTSVPVDTSVCMIDGPHTAVVTTVSPRATTVMAVDTTKTSQSTASKGTATTLTFQSTLALVLCLVCTIVISVR